jgi:hypothetical protein
VQEYGDPQPRATDYIEPDSRDVLSANRKLNGLASLLADNFSDNAVTRQLRQDAPGDRKMLRDFRGVIRDPESVSPTESQHVHFIQHPVFAETILVAIGA